MTGATWHDERRGLGSRVNELGCELTAGSLTSYNTYDLPASTARSMYHQSTAQHSTAQRSTLWMIAKASPFGERPAGRTGDCASSRKAARYLMMSKRGVSWLCRTRPRATSLGADPGHPRSWRAMAGCIEHSRREKRCVGGGRLQDLPVLNAECWTAPHAICGLGRRQHAGI